MTDAKFGKYRLLLGIGHGGMADVYIAAYKGSLSDQSFNKLLVIKKLRPNLVDDPEFVTMLLDEGRLAARLNHPNVIQTYEIGDLDGEYFIAMEYLDGQPLNRISAKATSKKASLSPSVTCTILADVLAGLHHAHELADFDGKPLGVVHRDISPHNVFVTYAGQVKVVDFGIAKAVGRGVETREGIIKGKITYMAPEQIVGAKTLDRRADIFAVGLMLWDALAGVRMWNGLQELQIAEKLISGAYPRHLREQHPDVPEELDRICAKALERDVDKRYATAAEFQADLEGYLRQSREMVTARELGELVSSMFADKRATVQQHLEERFAKLGAEEAVPRGSIPEISSQTPSLEQYRSGTPTMESAPARPEVGSETTMATVSRPLATPSQKPRMGVFVGIGLALLALGGVGVLAFRKPTTTSAAGDPASTVTVAATSHAAVPTTVEVSLRATPATVKFSIDEGPPLANPYVARVPRDGTTHIIRARAPGYVERASEVTYATEVTLDLSLEVDKSAKAPPTGAPGGTTGPQFTPGKLPEKKPARQLDMQPFGP